MNGDELDENGVFDLLNATVKRAKLDVTNGNGKHAADAAAFLTDLAGDDDDKMPQWYHDMRKWVDGFDARHAPKAQPKAAPAALTADEIQEAARRLTNLGIGYETAKLYADPVKLAEHERMQRRRDIANRLGVMEQFLPEGIENESTY